MKIASAILLSTLAFTTSTAFAAYSLSPYSTIATGSRADAVAIGDVNGDGRDDVVLTTLWNDDAVNDYQVFVFLQSGNGTLDAPLKFTYGAADQTGLALADLDHDGRMEIIVGTFPGTTLMKVMRFRVGTRNPGLEWWHPYWGQQPAGIVAAIDVDRDGALDVIGQSGSPGGATVYFGDGRGAVIRQALLPTPVTAFNDLKSGDFNHDGFADIAVLSGNTPTHAYVYYNDGSDDLSPPLEMNPNPDAEIVLGALGAGDFNNDGLDDLVMVHDDNNLSVFYQRAAGGFDPLVLEATATQPNAIFGHDLDLDGREDLVVQHGDGPLGFYLQGLGGLGQEVISDGPYATTFNHQGIAAGDINGDGCTDVVNANYNYGLVVYAGHGCSPVADVAASLGLTGTTLALRVDNFGGADANAMEASVTVSTSSGVLTMGTLPVECALTSSSTTSATLLCFGVTLAAGTSRTVILPISLSGTTRRSQARASAHATTTSVELKLLNNSASTITHAL